MFIYLLTPASDFARVDFENSPKGPYSGDKKSPKDEKITIVSWRSFDTNFGRLLFKQKINYHKIRV